MMDNKTFNTKYTEAMGELASSNFDNCVQLLSALIDEVHDNKLVLISRGSAYLKLDNPRKALSDFDKAIAVDPNYARAYHLRGLAQEKLGKHEAALADFDRSIELDPEYGAGYYSRATLHAKMGHEDLSSDDIAMVTHLTNKNIEEFAVDNNVWRSQHLRVESILEIETNR
jgi:tetratricopeptide (TPR) repeat protein